MLSVAVLSNVLGLAIGAGLNLYAAVLVTGLGIHYGWLTQLPAELQILGHPAVLIAAGVMYAAEFVADKVPFFTPIWDGIHTFIRPAGAALLALGATGDMDPVVRTLAMLAAGTVALGAHSSKMGVRLMAHTTPEPATHSALSIAEDVGVVALLALVYQYPWVALPVLLALLIGMAVLLPFLWRVAKFLVSGLWGRVTSIFGLTPDAEAVPDWVPQQVQAVRVFSRKVKGAPRVWPGYLLLYGNQTQFTYKRWGRVRTIEVGDAEARPEWGFVFNVVRCSGGASFYVTKEWCPVLTSQTPGGASLQKAEYR
jgi:hypothetical protein